jgi:hypothetical protein
LRIKVYVPSSSPGAVSLVWRQCIEMTISQRGVLLFDCKASDPLENAWHKAVATALSRSSRLGTQSLVYKQKYG